MKPRDAVSRTLREGCALWWYDFLKLNLHLSSSAATTLNNNINATTATNNTLQISSNVNTTNNWWGHHSSSSSLLFHGWKSQPEATTVARIALFMMYNNNNQQQEQQQTSSSPATFPPNLDLKSSGFVIKSGKELAMIKSSKEDQNSQLKEVVSSSSSSSSSSTTLPIPAHLYVSALELLCRRYTSDSVPSTEKGNNLRIAFWKIAAYVAYRVVELDPQDVSRALSVVCEVPPPSTAPASTPPTAGKTNHLVLSGWDVPIFSFNNDNDSSSRSSRSNNNNNTTIITPRDVCSYLSCQARLRARRYQAMLSLQSLQQLPASVVPQKEQWDMEVLREMVVHDLGYQKQQKNKKNKKSKKQKTEESVTSLKHDQQQSAVSSPVTLSVMRQTLDQSLTAAVNPPSSSMHKAQQYLSYYYYQTDNSNHHSSTSVVWSLLPQNHLESNDSIFQQLDFAVATPATTTKNQDKRSDSSKNKKEEASVPVFIKSSSKNQNKSRTDDDLVGKSLLLQLRKRRPVSIDYFQNQQKDLSQYYPQSDDHQRNVLLFSHADRVKQALKTGSVTAKTVPLRPPPLPKSVVLKKSQLFPTSSAAVIKNSGITENKKIWGPAQRRRALIRRAEELLMFQPYLLNVRNEEISEKTTKRNQHNKKNKTDDVALLQTSSSSTTKKQQHSSDTVSVSPTSIWTSIDAWTDYFHQLSPQARSTMIRAATDSLFFFSSSSSSNSSSYNAMKKKSLFTLKQLDENLNYLPTSTDTNSPLSSTSSAFHNNLQTNVARLAFRTLMGYRKLGNHLLHASSALLKTVNKLNANEIVPKLSLTSSLPTEALALCAARISGSCEHPSELVPAVHLHNTSGLLSPSKSLATVMKFLGGIYLMNNNNNQQHSAVLEPFVERVLVPFVHQNNNSSENGKRMQNGDEDNDGNKFHRSVLEACTTMLFTMCQDLIVMNSNNSANSSAKNHLAKCSAIPLLVSTAVRSKSISVNHSYISKKSHQLSSDNNNNRLSVHLIKLALLQGSMLIDPFKFDLKDCKLVASQQENNNKSIKVQQQQYNSSIVPAVATTREKLLAKLHILEGTSAATLNRNGSVSSSYLPPPRPPPLPAKNKSSPTAALSNTTRQQSLKLMLAMLTDVSNNLATFEAINSSNNHEKQHQQRDPALRQAYEDLIREARGFLRQQQQVSSKGKHDGDEKKLSQEEAELLNKVREKVGEIALKINIENKEQHSTMEEMDSFPSGEATREELSLLERRNLAAMGL